MLNLIVQNWHFQISSKVFTFSWKKWQSSSIPKLSPCRYAPRAGCTTREAIDIVVWPNMANSRVVRPHQKWSREALFLSNLILKLFHLKPLPLTVVVVVPHFYNFLNTWSDGSVLQFIWATTKAAKKFRHLGFCVDVQLVVDFITWSVVAVGWHLLSFSA